MMKKPARKPLKKDFTYHLQQGGLLKKEEILATTLQDDSVFLGTDKGRILKVSGRDEVEVITELELESSFSLQLLSYDDRLYFQGSRQYNVGCVRNGEVLPVTGTQDPDKRVRDLAKVDIDFDGEKELVGLMKKNLLRIKGENVVEQLPLEKPAWGVIAVDPQKNYIVTARAENQIFVHDAYGKLKKKFKVGPWYNTLPIFGNSRPHELEVVNHREDSYGFMFVTTGGGGGGAGAIRTGFTCAFKNYSEKYFWRVPNTYHSGVFTDLDGDGEPEIIVKARHHKRIAGLIPYHTSKNHLAILDDIFSKNPSKTLVSIDFAPGPSCDLKGRDDKIVVAYKRNLGVYRYWGGI